MGRVAKMEKSKISFLNKDEEFLIQNILFLRQLIKEKKASPEDYHQLGILYYILKNYQKSLKILDELIRNYKDYVDINRVYKLKILCLIHLKRFKEAIHIIRQRLYYNQQDTSLLHILAYCYEKLHNYKEALLIHKKVLDIDPENQTSLNAYGYLLVLHGPQKMLPVAKEYIQKALKKDPNNICYLDSYAVYLNKIGKKDLAKEILLKALAKDPNNSELIFHLKEIEKK